MGRGLVVNYTKCEGSAVLARGFTGNICETDCLQEAECNGAGSD